MLFISSATSSFNIQQVQPQVGTYVTNIAVYPIPISSIEQYFAMIFASYRDLLDVFRHKNVTINNYSVVSTLSLVKVTKSSHMFDVLNLFPINSHTRPQLSMQKKVVMKLSLLINVWQSSELFICSSMKFHSSIYITVGCSSLRLNTWFHLQMALMLNTNLSFWQYASKWFKVVYLSKLFIEN